MPENGQIKWTKCSFLFAQERTNKMDQLYFFICPRTAKYKGPNVIFKCLTMAREVISVFWFFK